MRQRIWNRVRNRLRWQSPFRRVDRNTGQQLIPFQPTPQIANEARTEPIPQTDRPPLNQEPIIEEMAYQNKGSRPLVPVRLEMPKYSISLSRVNVKVFIERWQIWATTQVMREAMAKHYFAFSFHSHMPTKP